MITEKRNHSAFNFITTHICCYRNCEYFSIRCATHCQFCIVFVCTVIRKREMDMAHSHICCIKPTHKRHPILTTYFICDAIRLCVCVCVSSVVLTRLFGHQTHIQVPSIFKTVSCATHTITQKQRMRGPKTRCCCARNVSFYSTRPHRRNDLRTESEIDRFIFLPFNSNEIAIVLSKFWKQYS